MREERHARIRILRILIPSAVVGLLLVGLAAAPMLMPAEWARKMVVSAMERATHCKVKIGDAVFTRWGAMSLSDIVILSPGEQRKPPLMTAKTCKLHVKLLPLLRKRLIIKKFVFIDPIFRTDTQALSQIKFGESGPPPSPDEFMARFAVEHLLIDKAKLVVSDESGDEAFSVTDFRLSAQGALHEPLFYKLNFKLSTPKFSGEARSIGTLMAFREAGHNLLVKNLEFVSDPFSASLSGSITAREDEPEISMRLRAEGELEPLAAMLEDYFPPLPESVDIGGSSKLIANISGRPDCIHLAGHIDWPEVPVTYMGQPAVELTGPDDVAFELVLEPNKTTIEKVAARSSLGFSVLKGVIHTQHGKRHCDLTVESSLETDEVLRVLRLREGLVPPPFDLSGFVHAQTNIREDEGTFSIKSDLDLTHVSVEYGKLLIKEKGESVKLTLDTAISQKGLVIVEGTRLTSDFTLFPVKGKILLTGDEPRFDIALSPQIDTARWLARARASGVEIPPAVRLEGYAQGTIKMAGTAQKLDISGAVDLSDCGLAYGDGTIKKRGVRSSFDLDMHMSETEIGIDHLSLEGSLGKISIAGKILDVQRQPELDMKMAWHIDTGRLLRLISDCGVVLPPDVRVDGQTYLEVAMSGAPSSARFAVNADVKDINASYKNAPLKRRGESPNITAALSLGKKAISIEGFLYRGRANEARASGKVNLDSKGPSATAAAAVSFDLASVQPLLRNELCALVERLDTHGLQPNQAELVSSLPDDLKVSGLMRCQGKIQFDQKGIQFEGTAACPEAEVVYRDIPLKARKSDLDARFVATASAGKLDVGELGVSSPLGKIALSGSVRPSTRSFEYDAKLTATAHLDRLASSFPYDEVRADSLLDAVLTDAGISVTEIERDVRLNGKGTLSLDICGDRSQSRISGCIDLTEAGMDYLETGGYRKDRGKPAMAKFDCAVSSQDFRLTFLDAECGDDHLVARGELVCTPNRIKSQELCITMGGKNVKTSIDITDYTSANIGVRQFEVCDGKNTYSASGEIHRSDRKISTDDFLLRINDDRIYVSLDVEKYRTDEPAIRAVVSANQLDLRQLFEPPVLKHSQPQTARLIPKETKPEEVSEKLLYFLRHGEVDMKVFAGSVLFDADDEQDKAPGLRHYVLNNLALKMVLARGTLISDITFVLDGGIMDVDWHADFTGPLMEHHLSIWADGLEANDNLRPLLNATFNNLHVEGDMGFMSKVAWKGLSQDNRDLTFRGDSKMWVNKGYLIGKAAPDYILRIFPPLKLAKFPLDRADITSNANGPISQDKMTFVTGTLVTYMHGTTDARTQQVDYIFGVELVDSLGLGNMRHKIPDVIENNARVNIVRYRGSVYDQHAEWFKLRGDAVADTLKRLIQWRTIKTLFSFKKSPEEKMQYVEDRLANIIGTPIRWGEKIIAVPKNMFDSLSNAMK